MSAIPTSELYYSSKWDVDQVFLQGTQSFAMPAGIAIQPLLVSHGLNYVPVSDITWQFDGGVWNQPAAPTIPSVVYCSYYITDTGLYAIVSNEDSVDHTVTVRYKVGTDMVVY